MREAMSYKRGREGEGPGVDALRRCERCGGYGPTLWDTRDGRYLAKCCHSSPGDFPTPLSPAQKTEVVMDLLTSTAAEKELQRKDDAAIAQLIEDHIMGDMSMISTEFALLSEALRRLRKEPPYLLTPQEPDRTQRCPYTFAIGGGRCAGILGHPGDHGWAVRPPGDFAAPLMPREWLWRTPNDGGSDAPGR